MQQENQQDLFTNLNIDHEGKQYIRTMATWAMIVVAVSVIGYVISVVDIIVPKKTPAIRSEGFSAMLQMGESNIISSIITIIVGLVVNYFLYKFSILARRGVDELHQQSLNSSFNNLKTYFTVASVLTIIAFVVVCLAVVVLVASS